MQPQPLGRCLRQGPAPFTGRNTHPSAGSRCHLTVAASLKYHGKVAQNHKQPRSEVWHDEVEQRLFTDAAFRPDPFINLNVAIKVVEGKTGSSWSCLDVMVVVLQGSDGTRTGLGQGGGHIECARTRGDGRQAGRWCLLEDVLAGSLAPAAPPSCQLAAAYGGNGGTRLEHRSPGLE